MRRKATYLSFTLAALIAGSSGVQAQTDPFGSLYAPPAGTTAPSTRSGSTGVTTAAGGSYATAQGTGYASLAQMALLPKTVAPLSLPVKENGGKYLGRSRKVVIPTYALAIVRAGQASAYAGGWGAESVQRRTSVSTVLVGVSDEMAAALADEAYKDLAQRLTEAGFEVVPSEQVQADAGVQGIRSYGAKTKVNDATTAYGPAYAPLRAWAPFMPAMAGPAASIAYGKVAGAHQAIVLSPGILIDYQQLESSGRRTYSGNASAGAKVHFGVGQGSGANLIVTPPPPYKGGWPSTMLTERPSGSDEQFGVMYEVDDKSDSRALHQAFAMLGSNMYRQSKYYAVEVEPDRYAALVRAAFQGLNAAIVSELKKKQAG